MVSTKLGPFNGKQLICHQCISEEERKENSLPQGQYHYWTHGDKKILDAGEITYLVIQSCQNGDIPTSHLIDSKAIKEHYSKLYSAQMAKIKEAMKIAKKHTVDTLKQSGIEDPNVAKRYDSAINLHSKNNLGFPNSHGIFEPSREQAERIIGKENIDKFMSSAQQEQVFGEGE